MPAMIMAHDVDPKVALRAKMGDVEDFDLFNNQVLCAIYVRPEKTKSNIIIVDQTRDEDKSQGKVGLVVKCGETAFNDPSGAWFGDAKLSENDWVFFRASDGWPVTVNGVLCRILDDTNIRGRVQHPDQVW